jgi:hypothetical protein
LEKQLTLVEPGCRILDESASPIGRAGQLC